MAEYSFTDQERRKLPDFGAGDIVVCIRGENVCPVIDITTQYYCIEIYDIGGHYFARLMDFRDHVGFYACRFRKIT